MSGIVAIFDQDGNSVDRDVFRAALDRIDHRGPDGRGAWRDGPVALGHQQLQSTPESQYDTQPHRDGDLVVTADARLDNRDELFRALEVSNRGEPVPDSHLLLEAYREWGTDCVDHLVGAFAFVVWDGAAEQVFCARDHFGVKPVYYRHDDDVFAVASELKALLVLPSVPRTLDEVRVGDFLVGLFGDKTNTMYEGLDRLPPAHATVVDADGAETWQYWDLDPTRTISLESDAAYERRFRELFEQAVEDRLRTPDPVGATLSGGIDSSSVVVMARDRLPAERSLHTFSWTFDDAPESDEREYAKSVSDMEGITPHYLSMDDVGVLVDAENVFSYYDEPPQNTTHYAWWKMSQAVADTGVGTLLTGTLGDNAIGYGRGLFIELLRQGRLRSLYNELCLRSDRVNSPIHNIIKQRIVLPLAPDPVLRRYRSVVLGQRILEDRWNPTLDQEFVDRIGLRARHKELYENWNLFGVTARRQQYNAIKIGLTTLNLEYGDLRGAVFGFEPRHPFADKRLVEFSLAMPVEQQLADGYPRSIIRRSIDDLLPEKICTRLGKTYLNAGIRNALSKETDQIQLMLDEPGRVSEFHDMEKLREAYEQLLDDDAEIGSHERRALWYALSLWTWLRATDSVELPTAPGKLS